MAIKIKPLQRFPHRLAKPPATPSEERGHLEKDIEQNAQIEFDAEKAQAVYEGGHLEHDIEEKAQFEFDEEKTWVVYESGQDKSHFEESPTDVHICNSCLCTACFGRYGGNSSSCVTFIKLTGRRTPKKPAEPLSNVAKNNLSQKMIIENITSAGTILSELSELLNQSEPSSDDESILNFIESIEQGETKSVLDFIESIEKQPHGIFAQV